MKLGGRTKSIFGERLAVIVENPLVMIEVNDEISRLLEPLMGMLEMYEKWGGVAHLGAMGFRIQLHGICIVDQMNGFELQREVVDSSANIYLESQCGKASKRVGCEQLRSLLSI